MHSMRFDNEVLAMNRSFLFFKVVGAAAVVWVVSYTASYSATRQRDEGSPAVPAPAAQNSPVRSAAENVPAS